MESLRNQNERSQLIMDKHSNYNNHLYSYSDPQSYRQLSHYLSCGKRKDKTTDRPIANNTRVIRRSDDSIAIKLHNTDILTFHSNGAIQLFTGGWKTVTTKDRMNRFLPSGIGVYSEKFIWYLTIGDWRNGKKYLYEDMMWIDANGNVIDQDLNPIPEHSPEAEKAKRKQLRKIDSFIRKGLKRLAAGEITQSMGDCFICQAFNGQPIADVMYKGELKDGQLVTTPYKEAPYLDCLQSHIDENYFHFSLVMNAVKSEFYDPDGQFGNPNMTYGLAPIDKHNLSVWANGPDCGHSTMAADMTIKRLQRGLKQFICKQLGI